jgi:hypothetical protein
MYDYISLEGDPAMTLPVSLTSFSANAENQIAKLKWITSSEQNNSHFEILRSIDGVHFKSIGTVKGRGTTAISNSYSFDDLTPHNGFNYYKLIQYDFNGISNEQGIKVVNFTINNTASVSIFPNPTPKVINVNIKNILSQEVTISLSNISGSTLIEQKFNSNETGNYELNINKDLSPGTYLVKINAGTFSHVAKVLVL